MKNSKRIFAGFAAVLMAAAMSVTTFAASEYNTPAEAVAGITGKTEAEVIAERQEGKPFGTIAAEAGKLEEFKSAMLEMQKDTLAARVADDTLTQAQADEILSAVTERQAICNGTGNGGGFGGGFGCGGGGGYGGGWGRGMGRGIGNAACLYN